MYDAVVCVGVVLDEHWGTEIFDEMLLALKPGGYIVIGARSQVIETKCQTRIDELIEEGKWELFRKEEFTRYVKCKYKNIWMLNFL